MSKKKQDDFLKLYKPVHERFERFCRARVYGMMEYEDLINETLLVAYSKFDTLKNPSAFFSFLCGISVRLLSNQNRKSSEESMQLSTSNVETENRDSEVETDLYILYELLNELPDVQRECIVLFEISGFSIKEISSMQEASESAVKQRLKRGRSKLSELMNFRAIEKRKENTHGY